MRNSFVSVVFLLVVVAVTAVPVEVTNNRAVPDATTSTPVVVEEAVVQTNNTAENNNNNTVPDDIANNTVTNTNEIVGETTTTATTSTVPNLVPVTKAVPPSNKGMEDSGLARVLVAVVTAPAHEDARRSIRNTWAALPAHHKKRIDVRFFVGVIPETQEHKDAIEDSLNRSMDVVRLNDFTENYHNLTLKAKGIFDWAFTHGYDALMKVDDDSYVRIDKLLHFVDIHTMSGDLDNIYAGHINRQEFGECYVHRNPNSKWYMYDQYPHDQFPDFADGPGFLLGRNALSYISQNKQFLFNYRCDDAAVGIWTELLGLTKIDMKVSIYEFTCSSDDIIINPVSAGEMFTLHNYAHICDAGYTLEVCLDKPCLCKGHPDRQKCWQDIIDLPYQDIIPRL